MSDEKIVLVARLQVREDAVEEAKRAVLGIVADSRAEDGCINYDVHQSIDDPTIFIWHETWKIKPRSTNISKRIFSKSLPRRSKN